MRVILDDEECLAETVVQFRRDPFALVFLGFDKPPRKAFLNKALAFDNTNTAVKRDLVDAEAVRLKTAGVAWSYQFVRVTSAPRLLLFGSEDMYNEVTMLPCKMVLRCLVKAKRQVQ